MNKHFLCNPTIFEIIFIFLLTRGHEFTFVFTFKFRKEILSFKKVQNTFLCFFNVFLIFRHEFANLFTPKTKNISLYNLIYFFYDFNVFLIGSHEFTNFLFSK